MGWRKNLSLKASQEIRNRKSTSYPLCRFETCALVTSGQRIAKIKLDGGITIDQLKDCRFLMVRPDVTSCSHGDLQ